MCVICKGKVNFQTTNIYCFNCPNLTSLKGLENCQNLERLDIYNCPNFASFKGLSTCEKLTCSNCPNLTSLEGLENCNILKISKCPIKSLKPLSNKRLDLLDCSDCILLFSLKKFRADGIERTDFSNCPWLKCNQNKNYDSNMEKLIILQRSIRKLLFRRNLNKSKILN
jgi:hypothetical protein